MSTTENKTLEELAATVQLVDLNAYPNLAWEKRDEWQRNANGYRLQLRYQGRTFTFDFWRGIGCKGAPTARECLECLLSDSSATDECFENWAEDLGYDSASRHAHALYQSCLRIARKMKRLLGEDYDLFLDADR